MYVCMCIYMYVCMYLCMYVYKDGAGEVFWMPGALVFLYILDYMLIPN